MNHRLTQSNYDEIYIQCLLEDVKEREREKKRLKQLLTEVHSRMVRGGTQTVEVRLPCEIMDEIWEVIR